MALDWAVELLRLTIFSNDAVTASDKDWKAITGEDQSENRLTIPGGKSFVGAFCGGQFSISYAGKRLDLVLRPQDPGNQSELPVIGPWEGVLRSFVRPLEKWLDETEFPIVRLAFGGVLVHKTGTLEAAYKRLSELLVSVNVEPGKMGDLLFRVNWARQSDARPRLKLNRLTTWNAMRLTRSLLQVSGEQVAVTTPETEVRAVRFEFDNNTDASNTDPLEKSELIPIFKELVALAQENVDAGEKR